MLQSQGGHRRQLVQAEAGRGRWEGAAGRRTNAWGPSRADQGVAGVPRGWLGRWRTHSRGWRTALTLNTSISSSMSSSVSMSSRGSTMTFCTVPRSARQHGAQVLSATPRHLCPPLLGREGGSCWEGGRMPPSPSPAPGVAVPRVWRTGSGRCLQQRTATSQGRVGTAAGVRHGDRGRTRMEHRGSGTCIRAGEALGCMTVPPGWALGLGKDKAGCWCLQDGQLGRRGKRLDDGGLMMGYGKHVGWALRSGREEAGWWGPWEGHWGRGRSRLDGGIPRMGGITLDCWLQGWELG